MWPVFEKTLTVLRPLKQEGLKQEVTPPVSRTFPSNHAEEGLSRRRPLSPLLFLLSPDD